MALHLKHLGVFSFLRHQLVVGAAFGNPPVFQKENPVAKAGAGQPVRDKDSGVPGGHLIVLLINFTFGNGVQGGGGLVQKQSQPIFVKRPGQSQLLGFAAGQV